LCNSSGIENEHEILSCAQLEAQQEVSKVVDANALGAIRKNTTDIKVVKRDNIVLGIGDLKQKKVDAKATKSVAKAVVVETVNTGKQIKPINTIKVNNCEIVNRRPRSVTAAIFAHPIVLPKAELQTTEKLTQTTTANKARAQSATAKIFRASPQISVTSTIFAPRTEDMNKGFLSFSEDETGLTSKY
jgi:hypoxia-inducible factor 1 alpha